SCAKKVGVFVSEPIENILRYAEMLDVIQLHGNEDDAYITQLKERTGKPVIKAFKVTCAEDVQRAQQSKADCVLLDSGTGTGKMFDHTLIRDIGRPYFLAGGLNPDNVAEAVSALHPYAVDVSSGVETDGRKDPQKMHAFAEAVRSI
ncbi:MAG: phosphoribosylanthranilate isomerase, partial [Oscillospiraceae bacterium]|nr:phosphoribosylanthranilate isomerase [Oscillospiraceae bacterium]